MMPPRSFRSLSSVPLGSAALVGALALGLAALSFGCSAGDGNRRPRGDGGGTDAGSDGSPPRTDSGPGTCTPGQGGCTGNTYWECGDDGVSHVNESECENVCAPELGCVLCRPGSRRCDGDVSMFCNANGNQWLTGRDCAEWESTCGSDGYCTDPCGEAEKSSSNVGCEYWPTPLANTNELDASVFDFRVVVANPNDTPANITVTRNGSEAFSGTVDASGLQEIVLPWVDGMSFGIPEGSWESLITAGGAYRLTSDVPVIVSQFNPFEYNVGETFSYTNDATLLLPSHVLTGDYFASSYLPLSRRTGGGLGGTNTIRYPGYVAVVGITAEPAQVRVTPAGEVAAGGSGRIPATRRGSSFVVTLEQGEVAHIAAAPPPECSEGRPGYNHEEDCESTPFGDICDGFDTCGETGHDLTGTRIAADRPVAVFGGHTCAYIPYTSQACDHLETQMPPVQSWGKRYVGMPMGPGTTGNRNLVRVLAAFDGTTVTITPPQDGVSGGMLDRGEYLETYATSAFEVTADQAVMTAQYILGQYSSDPPADRGDPAMTALVPAEQYRSDYTFILPSSYNPDTNGQNYLMVVRPPGLDLTLDGSSASASWQSVAGREVGLIELEGGTHSIEASDAFGLVAYGLGRFTSYATPAGLNLEQITILY